MITEDYCSPEVAKLLREKGFDEPCRAYWDDQPSLNTRTLFWTVEPHKHCDREINAPTHQTAMKWLREEHGFHISVAPYLNNEGEVTWVWGIINIETATIIADSLDNDFNSCEEVVEAALKHCLTELI